MKSNVTRLATVVSAFAAGLITGVLLAPTSGDGTRRRIVEQAKYRLHSAEKQLDQIEQQITEMNDVLQERGKELQGKLKKTAHDVVDQHIPDLAEGTDEWSEGGEDEMLKDLRNMTRR